MARKVMFPERALDKAALIVKEIEAKEVALPEVREEDIARLNYLRLGMTLFKLSQKDDMDMSEKLDVGKHFQQQFAAKDDEETEDDNGMEF